MSISSLDSNCASRFRLVALAFLVLMLTAIPSLGQSRVRFVQSPSCPYDDDRMDLEISGLRIADKEVSFDAPFEANDDWLANLIFRINNRGSKPIAGIAIIVGLLEGVDEKLPMHASYSYGLQFIRMTAVPSKRGRSKLPTLVAPGKEIEITARGSRPYGLRYMDAILEGKTGENTWADFAAKTGARFHRMEVMGVDVLFTDGSKEDMELLVRSKCDGKQ